MLFINHPVNLCLCTIYDLFLGINKFIYKVSIKNKSKSVETYCTVRFSVAQHYFCCFAQVSHQQNTFFLYFTYCLLFSSAFLCLAIERLLYCYHDILQQ